MPTPQSLLTETIILGLRIVLAGLILLFLLLMMRAILRDLRTVASKQPAQTQPKFGKLTVVDPGQSKLLRGREFILRQPISIIGSAVDSTIRVDSPDVWPTHCQLRWEHEGMWVSNLASYGGTYLNQGEVNAPVQLTDGDTLRIGSILLNWNEEARD